MRKIMREKFIPYENFMPIQGYSGLPVELQSNARFDWMKNMGNVPGLVHSVIASAINPIPNDEHSGFNVGGIEIYRNDSKDYPYVYNKDIYPILFGINPSGLIAVGPFKDNEHWLTQFPERYDGIPVIENESNDLG
jgi:hypothetical protein